MYSRWMPPECSTELYHHGIRGMKWGERHGPPYPLSQKTHNAVVKGDSPFYAVSKSTGKISSVNPTDDLDNFFDDMENNQIKV